MNSISNTSLNCKKHKVFWLKKEDLEYLLNYENNYQFFQNFAYLNSEGIIEVINYCIDISLENNSNIFVNPFLALLQIFIGDRRVFCNQIIAQKATFAQAFWLVVLHCYIFMILFTLT